MSLTDDAVCTAAPSTALAVEQIAAFSEQARPDQLSSEIRQLFKRNILDSLGCALGALPGKPFARLRQQFSDYRAEGSCTLIGGGATSSDQAALYNSGLVRYVDLLDSYMSPGGLCHPADNFGGVLAVAESVGASGEDFMLALAVAYEVGSRFTAAVPVMGKGFNHALQLAMSLAASSGKLMRLTPREMAHAIAIAAVDNVSLAAVHSEPVSQWKGFSPGSQPCAPSTRPRSPSEGSPVRFGSSRVPTAWSGCSGRRSILTGPIHPWR